ncbi:hypothetical protein ACFVT9_21520 [Kitasatospora cineracea]|uniref:hypothetical protein n=1 Tax=Kitasatospora cineracea TaxID=88074 RepID=UPI0033C6C4A5
MPQNPGFARRLLLSVDVMGYGRRDDREHADVQRALLMVLNEAARAVGLDRLDWSRQGAGDSEFAVLPDQVSEPVVVDDFVTELHAALRYYNHGRLPDFRMRLRLAIHFGAAMEAENGYAGQGVVRVNRLVESDPPHIALEQDGEALLAVIVSDEVYRDVVVQRHTKLTERDFREVVVDKKETEVRAWLRVPGGDVAALRLEAPGGAQPPAAPGSGAPAREPGRGAGQTVHTVVNGSVHAPGAVFGISNGALG